MSEKSWVDRQKPGGYYRMDNGNPGYKEAVTYAALQQQKVPGERRSLTDIKHALANQGQEALEQLWNTYQQAVKDRDQTALSVPASLDAEKAERGY